jgi:hypothetical protein
MGKISGISRRGLLFSTAATLLVASIPSAANHTSILPSSVDWEEVLSTVIRDRNALIAGYAKDIRPYEIGTQEWCMEEALAAARFLAKGEAAHV